MALSFFSLGLLQAGNLQLENETTIPLFFLSCCLLLRFIASFYTCAPRLGNCFLVLLVLDGEEGREEKTVRKWLPVCYCCDYADTSSCGGTFRSLSENLTSSLGTCTPQFSCWDQMQLSFIWFFALPWPRGT